MFQPSPHIPYLSSSIGIIHVLGYTPTEGEQGVPITVHINFNYPPTNPVHVRLVVGCKSIPTNVRQLLLDGSITYQLEGALPPFCRRSFQSVTVPVRVDAFDHDFNMLDSVTFGEFTYWESGQPSATHSPLLTLLDGPPTKQLSDRALSSSSRTGSPRLHRRSKPRTALRRTRPVNSSEVLAVLDFVTPLADLCHGWDPSEIKAGRRLVRFWSIQDHHRLVVSCERITPEEYRACDMVVSCIYREDVDDCFITSVDIIYLLQKLIGEEFAVMEKNRIRRNLEGLRPTTVSKHRPGVGNFFQRIMDFPEPKPRNIEKDLKVFPWTSLDQALEKIISKYSMNTEPNDDWPYPPPPPPPVLSTATTTTTHLIPIEQPSPQCEKEDIKPCFPNTDSLDLMYPPSDITLSPDYIDPSVLSGSDPNQFMFGSPIPTDDFFTTPILSSCLPHDC